MVGKNFGEFGESGANAKVLLIQIYIVKLQVDSMTNEYRANSREHAWLKLVTTKSIQLPLQPMPVSHGLPGSLLQGSYAPSLKAFQIKHLYSCHPKYHHT